MMPLTISVAMCTFNGECFLAAQLESIATQERLPDELVVCDDRSSDRTITILQRFARQVSFPVRIEINTENLGSTRNFEECISLCQGTIVALADQDDIWYRHKLRRIDESFQKSSDVVAAFSDADVVDDRARPLGLNLWTTFGFDSARQKGFANGRASAILCNHPMVTGATMAFRRNCFDAMLPIPSKQFHDAWISFLLTTCGRFEVIPEPLMQYRRHQQQQVGPGAGSLLLWQQIAEVTRKGRQRRFEQIDRFQELYTVLNQRVQSFPHAEPAKREIEGKLAHLAHRAHLPKPRIARVFGVLHETVTGAYWHYSNGWKSIAKDLVLP